MNMRELMILIVPAFTTLIGIAGVIFFEIYDRREAKRKKEEAERASQA